MKPIASITAIAFASLLVWSCKKNIVSYLETTSTDGQASIKIVHASPYTTNYPVVIKVNDIRVSNNITNATPFPGGGLNTGGASSPWYLSMKPGKNQVSLSVPKVGTSIDSIALFTTNINVEANKYYSAYITDTAANTKLVLVPENMTTPTGNTTRFKFVNLIPNVPALDLYWGTNKVASNIAYTGVSPEFTLNRGDTARWYVRTAGAAPTAAPVAFYPVTTGTSVSAPLTVPYQRVMTVFARGYSGGTSNRAPAVSLLYTN
jgi:hypothetical protein